MAVLVVRHLTKYRYKRPVRLGEHRMMFRPRDSFDQRLLHSHLAIFPSHVAYVGSTTCSATALRFSISTHSVPTSRLKAPFALIMSRKMPPTFRLRSTQSFTHSSTVPSNCPTCPLVCGGSSKTADDNVRKWLRRFRERRAENSRRAVF